MALIKLLRWLRAYRARYFLKPWKEKTASEKAVYFVSLIVIAIVVNIIMDPIYDLIGIK